MTAIVKRLASDSDDQEWTITVKRVREYLGDAPAGWPRIDDVPADIRAALLAWLKSGEGLDGCWNFQPVDPLAGMVVSGTTCRNCMRPYREHV